MPTIKELIEEQEKGLSELNELTKAIEGLIYQIASCKIRNVSYLKEEVAKNNLSERFNEKIKHWHKQSLKQILEALIAIEQGKMVTLREKEDHLPNAYQWLKGKNEAREETISHIKNIIKELE